MALGAGRWALGPPPSMGKRRARARSRGSGACLSRPGWEGTKAPCAKGSRERGRRDDARRRGRAAAATGKPRRRNCTWEEACARECGERRAAPRDATDARRRRWALGPIAPHGATPRLRGVARWRRRAILRGSAPNARARRARSGAASAARRRIRAAAETRRRSGRRPALRNAARATEVGRRRRRGSPAVGTLCAAGFAPAPRAYLLIQKKVPARNKKKGPSQK